MSEPVRSVVLTEILPGFGPNDAFVQYLENVLLDRIPVEAGQSPTQGSNENTAVFYFDNPVEEILFHNPMDAACSELLTAEQVGRSNSLRMKAKNSMGDDLGRIHKQCVLDE